MKSRVQNTIFPKVKNWNLKSVMKNSWISFYMRWYFWQITSQNVCFFLIMKHFFKKSSPHIFTHIINSLLTLRDVKEINQCLVYRNHLKWQTFKLFYLFKSKTMFSKLHDMAATLIMKKILSKQLKVINFNNKLVSLY